MNVITSLLIFAAIIIFGFISNAIFKKTRIPDLIWLMLLGIIIGPVTGLLNRGAIVSLMPYLSALALLFILFDAGLNMNLYKLLKEMPRGSLLAFISFGFSMLAVGFISYYFLELNLTTGLLLGAIVGGVSSAIVIPIMSGLRSINDHTSLILEIESVITDPLAIIVSLALVAIISSGASGLSGVGSAIQLTISSFSISIVFGLFAGILWLVLLQHLKGEDYFYILTLGFLFLLYGIVELLGGSGAISALIIGLVLGNGQSIGRMLRSKTLCVNMPAKTRALQSEISFFIKTFFFVSLGAIITFDKISLILYGIMISLILLFVRSLAVWISTYHSKFEKVDKAIMAFMLPRGLSAAVLATIILVEYSLPGTEVFAEVIFSIIFSTAILSTLGVGTIAINKK